MNLTQADLTAIAEVFSSAPKCGLHERVEGAVGDISKAQTDLALAHAVLARDMSAQAIVMKDLAQVTVQVIEVKAMLGNSLDRFKRTEQEHSEIFGRLSTLDTNQASAKAYCQAGKDRIVNLEKTQGKCQPLKDLKSNQVKIIWTGIVGIGVVIAGFMARLVIK